MAQVIAVDFHCKYQKVMWLDLETGETGEEDLSHQDSREVRRFYQQFERGSAVGMEVSGYSYWFERLVEDLGLTLWVGHSGELNRMRSRKQKNDRRDAEHMLHVMQRGEFPTIWRPGARQREQRMLVRHMARLKRERTRWINVSRALVYNYNLLIPAGGLSLRRREQMRALEMSPRLSRLRDDLLTRIEQLEEEIRPLEKEMDQLSLSNESSRRVRTIPGIGPMTSLYLSLTLEPVKRFANAKKVVAYVGLDSVENSTDNPHKQRRYGKISKQGDRTLRWLLQQSANSAVRASTRNAEMRRVYTRLLQRKHWAVARTAVARKLLVCSYILLREGIDYPEYVRRGASRGRPVLRHDRKVIEN